MDVIMTSGSRSGCQLSLRTPPYWQSRVMVLVIVLAGLLLANMITGGPASHPAYAQTVDSSIDFAENGASPVGTFNAYDQDGDAIRWSLSGPDDDLFTIDGGVLSFVEPPDYEDPQSAARGGQRAEQNVYRITIEASGGMHDVAVTVTDVDEVGTVSIDRPQPQVDRPLGASLSDEDDGVTGERWQWARSEDGTTWTEIRGTITPRRSPASADVGMYLRATVTYSDKFASGKTASAVSAYRVEARTLSNTAPSFVDQDDDEATAYIDIARSVAENTAAGMTVGKPLSATDADNDILFYELVDTPDLKDDDDHARFTIDSASGQIRVGKLLGADVGEREDEDSTALGGGTVLPQGEDAGGELNGEYVLRIRVSDPSTASAAVNVVVTVAEVNEAPRFDADTTQSGIQNPPTELSVIEGDAVKSLQAGTPLADLQGNTYAVTDEDAADGVPEAGAYLLKGADKGSFRISPMGALSVAAAHTPDYEDQSSYSITIVAHSGEGSRRLTATLEVTVEVVDAEDAGEVVLSQREPQAGTEVHARASDPDGGVKITMWAWERSAEITVDDEGAPSAECRDDPGTSGIAVGGGWTPIGGATSAAYLPRPVDVGRCLRATATYTDNIRNRAGAADEQEVGTSEAPVQASSPANTAPQFVNRSDRTSRRVAENTKAGQNIGTPVSAGDEDGDLLMYTLGGKDAVFFGVSRNDGQLKTKAPLDHEARSLYAVVVTATDPSGAAVSIPVTINVTDEDEPAQITGISSIDFPENGTAPAAGFSAQDQDGKVIRWSLSGPDVERFAIHGGVLRFREPPDYEEPRSAAAAGQRAERNVYRVTIEASGGMHELAVTVTDVDEAGTVSIDRPQPQVDRPLGAALLDEDDGVAVERWQWARSRDGATWTDIMGATAPRRPPEPGDVGMYLRATVTYSDKFGSGKTAWAVSAYRVEARTLFNAAPSFADQDDDEDTPYMDVALPVAENTAVGMPIGGPVTASDDDDDILFYELLDSPDLEDDDGLARFMIDSAAGQIRVGKLLGADAGEQEDEVSTALTGGPALPAGEDAGEALNGEYVLRVRVSDPSTASATVNVIVTVTEVNEAPIFDEDVPTVLRVTENTDSPVITFEDSDTSVNAETYAVTDEDGSVTGPDTYDDTTYTYSVTGADSKVIAFNSAGILSFMAGHKPDYEKQSSYSIAIVARSGEGPRRLTASLDVIVEVVDAEDTGSVLLSQRQPQLGIEIHATASDPDGGVTITKWVWERSAEIAVNDRGVPSVGCRDYPGEWTPIVGASSAVYTPRAADVGRCLRARAVYMDNIGDADEQATGVLEVPARGRRSSDNAPGPESGFVNAAPAFPDQDFLTPGDQSDRTSRKVAENTKAGRNIGSPVSAHDDDGDLLIYTLGGVDAASFRISRNDGQLKTRAPLNFEARNVYTVVVTATDPSGAKDSILVTINVTDEDDPAVIRVLYR